LETTFNIALIILSIALVAAILLQARGGGLGSMFGGEGMGAGQYKTRRGLEKTLFQVTIGLTVAFFTIVVVNVFILSR
jgi:preprotein translocase subunit SecG